MKAILEFNLPEEREKFETAQKSFQYRYVIQEMDEWLRRKLKYEELSDAESVIYQTVRDEFKRILDEEFENNAY